MSLSGDHFAEQTDKERPKRRQKPCGTLGRAREGAPLMLQSLGVSSIVREHRPQEAVVSIMGYSPSRCTDHLCVAWDPAADSNQTMGTVCRPSQRSSRSARDPGFASRPVGVTTPNGLAWTWKPITCRCKTIIQAAFGLWV